MSGSVGGADDDQLPKHFSGGGGAGLKVSKPAGQILLQAAEAVNGPRDRTHGDKVQNHQNIADHWNAYLAGRLDRPLSARDVALMMAELKIARTKLGEHNLDDYIDGAGYMGCAGEIAEKEQSVVK